LEKLVIYLSVKWQVLFPDFQGCAWKH